MDVPELVPLEEYDANQARLEASISWVLTRAFGSNIPPGLKDPLYTDKQDKVCLRPVVINGLVSSDIYCRACRHIFRETTMNWKGHMSVMQALSRKGIYVMDPKQSAVTETSLMQTSPFQLDSHLSLIDAMMTAYTVETVTIEKVVQAVRRFTSFNASSELPYDTEDSILFWMNKVCGTVRHRLNREQKTAEDQENIYRSRSKSSADSVNIPVMDDLLKDLNDGCCLATVISFYCPIALRLHDIAMSDNLGIADSMFNIQLVLEFCTNHLPAKVLHLTMNDMFYTSHAIKPHLLTFLAELFFWFEVKKADCVQDVSKTLINNSSDNIQDNEGDVSPSKKARTPISNATKKSFHGETPSALQSTDSTSTPNLHNASLSMPPARQPLLPKRLQEKKSSAHEIYKSNERIRRSRSFTSVHDRELKVHGSFQAWGEQGDNDDPMDVHDTNGRRQRVQHSPVRHNPHSRISQQSTLTNVTNSNLLSNVSIDSDGSLDISTDTSMTISGMDDTPRMYNREKNLVNDGDLDLQSVSSRTSASSTTSKTGYPGHNPTTNYHGHNPGHNPGENPGHNHGKNPGHNHGKNPGHNHGNNPGHNPGNNSGHKHGNNPGHSQSNNPTNYPGHNPGHNPGNNTTHNPGNNPGHKHGNSRSHDNSAQEPLMPAQIRPSKEKINNGHSKDFESGESHQRKSPVSPTKSAKMAIHSDPSVIEDSPSDSEYLTPSTESIPFDYPKQSEGQPLSPKQKTGLAFYVDTEQSLATSTPKSGRGTAQSFVVQGTEYTAESARAAGIPVVNSNEYKTTSSPRKQWGKPVQMFENPCSSSDGSDQELRKIRADHRDKESPKSGQSFFISANGESVTRPDSLNISNKGSKLNNVKDTPSPKTSFAEISQRKGNSDSNTHDNGTPSSSNLSLKEQFEKARGSKSTGKKTTFAALPNQTTWQETAKKSGQSPYDENAPDYELPGGKTSQSSSLTTSGAGGGSELVDVRMQLEERRRQIENEKRKSEMQWNRQRQKVGKQAFMQVITKGKEGDSGGSGGSKFIPKTIPENKEISPISHTSNSNEQNRNSQRNRRQSPSRSKVSRSQSERIPASQRSAHQVLRSKPLASEAEDRLQEIMQRLETIEIPKKSTAVDESQSQNSSTSSMKGLMEQDSLTNVNQANVMGGGTQMKTQQEQAKTTKKPFSRQDIQNRIDGVKQRWFSGEDRSQRAGSTPPRQQSGRSSSSADGVGMSHSSEDPLVGGSNRQQQPQKPPNPAAMSQSLGEQKEYSSSLDKLNTSLSELQGEIMRLSLQQDQIKCLVKDEKRASPTPTKMAASGNNEVTKTTQQQDKFYLYPREGDAGEPDVAGGMRTTQPATQPAVQRHQPESQPPSLPVQQHPPPPVVQPTVQPAVQPQPHQPAVISGQLATGQYPYGVAPYQPPYGGPMMTGGYVQPPIQHPSVQGYGQSPHYNPGIQTSPQHTYIMPPPSSVYQTNTNTTPWGTSIPPQQGYHPPPGVGAVSPHAGHIPPHTVAAMQGYYGPTTSNVGQQLPPAHTTTAVGQPLPPAHQQPQSPPGSSAMMYNTLATTTTHSQNTPQSPQQPVPMTTTSVMTSSSSSLPQSSPANSHHSSAPHSQHQSPATSQRQSPLRQSPMRNSPSPEKIVRSPPMSEITSPVQVKSPKTVSPTKPLNPSHFNDHHNNESEAIDHDEVTEGEPGQDGFFVVFDEGTPVKKKPQLGGRDRKKEQKVNGDIKGVKKDTGVAHSNQHDEKLLPSGGLGPSATAVGNTLAQQLLDGSDTGSGSTPPRSESPYGGPPEAFVIEHDEDAPETLNPGGLDKKKEKFMAMQNKRREEEARKKRKLDEERVKLKDEQRMKEEMVERKKAEEKSRRDQIFQDYLKRKESREIEQELSRAGMAPVQKRNQKSNKPKTGTRPKSQPPSSLPDADKFSASSHSSQEDLTRVRGRSPRDRARKGLTIHESPTKHSSREALFSADHPDSANHLAHGGLTHRRPPTPDKSRLPPGLGDYANNNNTDYSGPKLFKKPSSKSNRQVVNQAVSHCCLAGTVNNDMKNKVLETLNQSEYNHFVILFRDHSMQYRGLYTYNPETEDIYKLMGVGPKQVTSKMMEGFYKYNSGAKKFSQITTTKHMSATVDAITLHGTYWQKKKVEKKPPTGHY